MRKGPAFGESHNIEGFVFTKGTGHCFDRYRYGLITRVGEKAPWNTPTQDIGIVLEEGVKTIPSQAFWESKTPSSHRSCHPP